MATSGPIDWPVVGKQLGLGFVLGFAVGYAAKKALQVAIGITGILVVVLVVLQNYGFISIHWSRIEAVYSRTIEPPGGFSEALRGWVDSLAAMIPAAGGFTVGFFWGMKRS